MKNPYIKILVISDLLFLLSTAISLKNGTQAAQKLCSSLTGSAIENQFGSRLLHPDACRNIALVIEPWSFTFLVLGCLFITHVIILSNRLNIKQSVKLFTGIAGIFFTLYYVISSLLPSIRFGFPDGPTTLAPAHWISLTPGGVWAMFLVVLFVQIGPLLMRVFSYRYPFHFFEKRPVFYFMYVLVGSVIFQIIALGCFIFLTKLMSPRRPEIKVLPSNIQERRLKEVEIQLPTLAPKTIQLR